MKLTRFAQREHVIHVKRILKSTINCCRRGEVSCYQLALVPVEVGIEALFHSRERNER